MEIKTRKSFNDILETLVLEIIEEFGKRVILRVQIFFSKKIFGAGEEK